MTIDQNTAAIDVNTGNISAADGIINTGENDVDQIEQTLENLDDGWKKFVTSINFHGSDAGDVHYFDSFARL